MHSNENVKDQGVENESEKESDGKGTGERIRLFRNTEINIFIDKVKLLFIPTREPNTKNVRAQIDVGSTLNILLDHSNTSVSHDERRRKFQSD